MQIKYNKITTADYVKTPNISGVIKPKIITMHYTAGFNAKEAINRFLDGSTEPRVSAHLVIDLDGTITQMAPFNRKTWHAGPSRYHGYRNLNDHAIGIEVVNYGFMKGSESDPRYRDGQKADMKRFPAGVLWEKHSRVGSGTYGWPCYTKEQLEVLDQIVPLLIQKYGIEDIVSHEEIDTRGWKTDPGPAFPMERYRAFLTNDRTDEEPKHYVVTASSLNVRTGPGTNYEIFSNLKKDDYVLVKAKEGDWLFVTFGPAKDGWISSRYAVPE